MTRGSITRLLVAVLLVVLPSVPVGLAAFPVGAEPGPSTTEPDNAEEPRQPPGSPPALTLPWRALGLEQQIVLRSVTPVTYTVPVPAGLKAVRLLGAIRPPMNIGAGNLEISDGDGKFLASVPLPPANGRDPAPLDIDIASARVRSSSIDLSFNVIPVDQGDIACRPHQQVTISELAVAFAGAEPTAKSVASFFPPVLQRVTIYTPTDADNAEKQAVLTLVSTLARLYKLQSLAVAVVAQPRGAVPPPAPQLMRAIVVETGPAGITVENPGLPGAFLRISGKDDALAAQLSLFANQLQSLAQSTFARVDQPGSSEPLRGDILTFSQLKINARTNALRAANLSVSADRSSLGSGRVDRVQVRLLAEYTPVPPEDNATVLIRAKGVVVHAARLNETGLLDATFDLERQTFGQWVNLDFALTYTPNEPCGAMTAPLTFQIDPRSTLTVYRGGPPLDGFAAFPSEFSPGFMVAFDGSSPNQLNYAARVVAAIAKLTGSPLMPQVVDLKEALDATTGVLIVAKSDAIRQSTLNPPIGGDGAAMRVELPAELLATIDGGLGSVQAFADRPRNRAVVLVTTTGEWNLVGPLFDYIDGLNGGWSALTGDVVAAGPAGDPTSLAIRASDDIFVAQSEGLRREATIGVGLGLAAVAVIAALLTAVLWSRRRRAATAAPSEPETVRPPTPE